jgi:DNA polymerase-1
MKNQQSTPRLVLIDGYSFVFRAFYSLPNMTRLDKMPIGAIYGMMQMLIKLISELEYSHIAVVLDGGGKNFRHHLYPEYKAHRPECPENLKPQFPIVRQAIESLNITIIEQENTEADDLIGTFAKNFSKLNHQVLVVSPDKDLLQLVDDNILVYDAVKDQILDRQKVQEKLGVLPNQIIDFLAIVGDSADNIPGVAGIGPKGAIELLTEFHDLENIFNNIENIKGRKAQLLQDSHQKAILSKKLATLDLNLESTISFNDLVKKPIEANILLEFLANQGFASLFERAKQQLNLSSNLDYQKIVALQLAKIKGFANSNDGTIQENSIKNFTINSELKTYNIADIDTDNLTEVIDIIENSSGVMLDFIALKEEEMLIIAILDDNLPVKNLAKNNEENQKSKNNINTILYFCCNNIIINLQKINQEKLKKFNNNKKGTENEKNEQPIILPKTNYFVKNIAKNTLLKNTPADLFSFAENNLENQEIATETIEEKPREKAKNNTNDNNQKTTDLETNFSTELMLILDNIFTNNGLVKVFVNSKIFLKITENYHHFLKNSLPFEDLILLDHLVYGNCNFTTGQLLNYHFSNISQYQESLSLEALFEKQQNFSSLFSLENQEKTTEEEQKNPDNQKFTNWIQQRTAMLYSLNNTLKQEIFRQRQMSLYHELEKPLLLSIAQMESNGVMIDKIKLANLSQDFAIKIAKLTDEIYEIATCEFNIASPKQLSEVLFFKMQIPFPSQLNNKGKTEQLSTNVEVLQELSINFPIAKKILDFRHFTKLKNTYIDALPLEINQETNRIHSSFFSNSTTTGRLSSRNPNLQNLPIKTAEGKAIRSAVIASKNCVLISADYSQIELRVLATIAKVEPLILALNNNLDVHKITASEVFNISIDKVDGEMRNRAKAINFGIIYGISAFGLAKQLQINQKEAKEYIDQYFNKYPQIANYIAETIAKAKKEKFITTIAGRKCFLPNIDSKNYLIRSEAERLAVNASIQGSAADIIKTAMINLQKTFSQKNISAKILLQIHDELLIETSEENANEVAKIVNFEMANAYNLAVKLKVDIEINKNW